MNEWMNEHIWRWEWLLGINRFNPNWLKELRKLFKKKTTFFSCVNCISTTTESWTS